MSSLQCRLGLESDLRALAEMRWRLKTDDAPVTDPAEYEAFLAAFASSPLNGPKGGLVHWVAERDRRIIAAMTVVIVPKVPAPDELNGEWGYLTNAYAFPDARNEGVGSALLMAIKAWATERGLELLLVWPSDLAYPFYERAGFASGRDPLTLKLN